ncbi:MAG: HD domain-containing protein [Lachnospiraceae bacterium]|nr:HD domain-containing protein [Lachnospiraceae bacterium]
MGIRELIALLRNSATALEIDKYRNEIIMLIPSVKIMVDFNQQNLAHQYDLWKHCLQTVVGLSKTIDDDMVYLAAMLHDIGKPDCQIFDTKDGKVNMHYYGHPKRSMEIVRDEIIPLLTSKGEILSSDEQIRLLYYVEYHDDRMSLRMKHMRRHLNMGVSLDEFQNLMLLQVADAKAHVQIRIIQNRIEICEQLAGEYGQMIYSELLSGK